MTTGKDVARGLFPGTSRGEPVAVPILDPLGLLEGEAQAARSPVVPVDLLAGLCSRWLGGMFEARDRAVKNYADALAQQPLDPGVRLRAIENYARALFRPRR